MGELERSSQVVGAPLSSKLLGRFQYQTKRTRRAIETIIRERHDERISGPTYCVIKHPQKKQNIWEIRLSLASILSSITC